MTRQLFSWELPQLEAIAAEFHGQVGMGTTFSPEIWQRYIIGLYESQALGAFGFFSDGQLVGALVANIFPHSMCDKRVASEIFWYVRPEYRKGTSGIRLLSLFEDWAKKRGADLIIMAHFADDERIGRLYEGRDYTRVETHYLKWLSQPSLSSLPPQP